MKKSFITSGPDESSLSAYICNGSLWGTDTFSGETTMSKLLCAFRGDNCQNCFVLSGDNYVKTALCFQGTTKTALCFQGTTMSKLLCALYSFWKVFYSKSKEIVPLSF